MVHQNVMVTLNALCQNFKIFQDGITIFNSFNQLRWIVQFVKLNCI